GGCAGGGGAGGWRRTSGRVHGRACRGGSPWARLRDRVPRSQRCTICARCSSAQGAVRGGPAPACVAALPCRHGYGRGAGSAPGGGRLPSLPRPASPLILGESAPPFSVPVHIMSIAAVGHIEGVSLRPAWPGCACGTPRGGR